MQQSITTEKTVYDAKKEEHFNLELSLPEYLPGISRIVKTNTVIKNCALYTENSKAFGDIDARFDIVYISDFGEKLKCASFDESFRLPFKEPFDCSNEYSAFPSVYASTVVAKPLSSRKINLKGVLNLSCNARVAEETELFINDENSKGICTLSKTITCCNNITIQNPDMSAAAELNLEKSSPAASEVILPKASVHSLSCNCEQGKVNIKGKLSIYALYECVADEAMDESRASYASVSSEADFECSIEDSRINDSMFCNPYVDVTGVECSCSYDSYGESRIINFDIKYTLICNLFENKQYDMSEDAFSTSCLLQTQTKRIVCHKVIKTFHFQSSANETVYGDLAGLTEISHCFVQIKSVSKESVSSKAFAHAKCLLEIIGINSMGELVSADLPVTFHIPFEETEECDESIEFYITAASCNATVRDGAIDASVTFDVNGICKEISSCTTVQAIKEDKENPIVKNKGEITVFYPCKNDTLWSVAKKYSVSPQAILNANKLDGATQQLGSIVIIP